MNGWNYNDSQDHEQSYGQDNEPVDVLKTISVIIGGLFVVWRLVKAPPCQYGEISWSRDIPVPEYMLNGGRSSNNSQI